MVKKMLVSAILLVSMFGIAFAEDIEGGFLFGPQYRTYTLHIPPGYNAEDSVPLLINLHGGGGDAAQQATMTQMNLKADADTFLVVYPNGTTLPAGYTGWNAGEWAETEVDDAGFISALIDTVVDNYNVDTLRIYATGFSLGAMMCHTLACEIAVRIAAVAPVEGGLTLDDWGDCRPQRLMPVMHFHHRNDATVPYYGDSTKQWAPPIDSVMEFWAQRNGCDIGPDTFYNENDALRQTWTRADDSCEVVFWTLEQGNGHQWPGSPTGSQELSANELMWEFFLAHPMPVEEEPGVEESRTPPSYELDPAYPGVFSQTATIRFTLGQREHVTLKVFDALGRKVVTIADGVLDAGEHTAVLVAADMQSGVYFYRLETPTFSKTQSIRLLK